MIFFHHTFVNSNPGDDITSLQLVTEGSGWILMPFSAHVDVFHVSNMYLFLILNLPDRLKLHVRGASKGFALSGTQWKTVTPFGGICVE